MPCASEAGDPPPTRVPCLKPGILLSRVCVAVIITAGQTERSHSNARGGRAVVAYVGRRQVG